MTGILKGVNYSDPVVRYRGERVIKLVKRLGSTKDFSDVDLAIDVFYSLYLPHPITLPVNSIPLGKEINYYVVNELINSPYYNELKPHTITNSLVSTLISASFINHVANELKGTEGAEEGEGVDEGSIDRATVKRAVNKALNQVKEESQVIKSVEKLLSAGHEAGTGTAFDMDENGEDVLELARNTDVRKLLEVISMIPSLTYKVRRRVRKYSRGELSGYEIGSDLERLVPTELVYPRTFFYIRLAEGKLLLYDKVLPETLGPFYVLIDKSGSMEGEKIRWAKATALALFMRARKEGREFYLRFFDGLPHPLIRVPRRMKASDTITLLDYLARVSGGGGTDITRAIATACDDIAIGSVKGISDIIVITDGEDRVSELIIRRKLKAADARLITVMIIGENRDLKRLSNRYLRASKLSEKEILQVVET
jgi:uncharacterized protein with von Willebrand factor type A (vWA) domain